MKDRSSEAGYTLLEMVLAISIFSMVMLIVGMSILTIQQTWKKIKQHNYKLESYLNIDRVLDSAFKNAIPFHWLDDDNKDRQIFVGNSDGITLAYQHRIGNVSQGGIRFIRLKLDSNQNLIAEYRQSPIIVWKENDSFIKREVLSANVEEISFLYADYDGDELVWKNDWEENDNPNIPLAIQITIRWDDGRVESWLRRTAGNGLKETLGERKPYDSSN
jgi:general secretion pathway protein J